jgi:hypothetical protein
VREELTHVEAFLTIQAIGRLLARIEVAESDKHTSLLNCGINYGCKKLCSKGLKLGRQKFPITNTKVPNFSKKFPKWGKSPS